MRTFTRFFSGFFLISGCMALPPFLPSAFYVFDVKDQPKNLPASLHFVNGFGVIKKSPK